MKKSRKTFFKVFFLQKVQIDKNARLPFVDEFLRDNPRKDMQNLDNYMFFLELEYEIYQNHRDSIYVSFEDFVRGRYSKNKYGK